MCLSQCGGLVSHNFVWWQTSPPFLSSHLNNSAGFGIVPVTSGAKVCKSRHGPPQAHRALCDLYICSEFTACEIVSVNSMRWERTENQGGGSWRNNGPFHRDTDQCAATVCVNIFCIYSKAVQYVWGYTALVCVSDCVCAVPSQSTWCREELINSHDKERGSVTYLGVIFLRCEEMPPSSVSFWNTAMLKPVLSFSCCVNLYRCSRKNAKGGKGRSKQSLLLFCSSLTMLNPKAV